MPLIINLFSKKNKIEFARKFIHMLSILIPLVYRYIYTYLKDISIVISFQDKQFMIDYKEFTILCLLWFLIVSVLIELLRLENRSFRRLFNLTFGIMLRSHEKRDFTGASYLLTSAIVCIAIFPENIAFVALAFLSIGDTFAALVGINFGKRKLPGSKKSFEGLLACFFSTLSFGLVFGQLDPIVVFFGAVAASLAEVVNISIDDNVKIPVMSAIIMWITHLIIS